MKKLLLTSGIAFCLAGSVLAQEPARATAKKAKPELNATHTSQPESKEASEARLKAKKAHYEAMQAAKAQPATTNTPASKAAAAQGARKRSN